MRRCGVGDSDDDTDEEDTSVDYGFAVVGVIPHGTSAGSSAGSAVETVTTLPHPFCKGKTCKGCVYRKKGK